MVGSLVQVDTFTISSAVSSVIIGGGSSGSSSYNFAINTDDVYIVTYNNLYMTNDGNTTNIRFTVSGSADTTSNYDQAGQGFYTNQAFYESGNSDLSNYTNYGMGTTAAESQCGIWYLYNFNNSSGYSYAVHDSFSISETPEYIGNASGRVLTVNQACDGIQYSANANNIASGTWTMYRVV